MRGRLSLMYRVAGNLCAVTFREIEEFFLSSFPIY
jgi:hypothetical protein